MNCKFRIGSFDSITCCFEKYFLENLPSDINDRLLSEIGLLNTTTTRKYQICKKHKEYILEKNRLASISRKICAMPVELVAHKGKPRGDRKLTKEAMVKIFTESGKVLPIGTPICSRCRQQFSGRSEDRQTLNETCMMTGVLTENSNIRDAKHENEPKGQISKESEMVVSEKDYSQSICSMDYGSSSQELSQESEASVCTIEKRDQLNIFLQMAGVSPVKEKKVPLSSSCNKTAKQCVGKALQCLSAVCDTICPGEGNMLKDMVEQFVVRQSSLEVERHETDSTLLILKDVYINAESWTFQRQILSIIAKDRSYSEVKGILPDLSSWKFYQARHHTDNIGCGVPVPVQKVSRCKVEDSDLEHFIDFILSSHVVKDLPYGLKRMKLSTGEVVEIPNVIRSLAPSTIIKQYMQICEADNIKHLAQSTLFKILNDCSASVRKCIEGLDYYVAEGTRAFQSLQDIVSKLPVDEGKATCFKEKLLRAKSYMKSEYKIHICKESLVADHCRYFSLSSSETCFSASCSHQHEKVCIPCSSMESILDEISDCVNASVWENKDSILFEVEAAVESVKEWKNHIIRSKNQEDARLDLLKHLKEGQVLVTCDWAMKFLPRKFREGQTDWFGKRGINWHISVSVFQTNDDIKTLTHVHIFSSQISQDSAVTAAIIKDVYLDLKKSVRNFKELYIFSDNAGCYKNTFMMAFLKKEIGPHMQSYNFSEAQDGKGPCDRRASHIKSIIKRHINEGNDVTTAEEMKIVRFFYGPPMKEAIDSSQKKDYRVKVVDVATVVDKKSTLKPINGITQLFNFNFEATGLRVWKAYAVGYGKLLPWNEFVNVPEGTDLLVQRDWSTGPIDLDEDEYVSVCKKRRTNEQVMLECPKEYCCRSFSTQQSLDNHLMIGDCEFQPRAGLHDKAKVMYGNKVNNLHEPSAMLNLPLDDNDEQDGTSTLSKGWALKPKKKRAVFSEQQNKFLKEKFDIGKRTGRKVDPYVVSEEMRQLKNKDGYVFSKDKYLSGQQIASYFSRMAVKDRKCDAGDYSSAILETTQYELKTEILSDLNSS